MSRVTAPTFRNGFPFVVPTTTTPPNTSPNLTMDLLRKWTWRVRQWHIVGEGTITGDGGVDTFSWSVDFKAGTDGTEESPLSERQLITQGNLINGSDGGYLIFVPDGGTGTQFALYFGLALTPLTSTGFVGGVYPYTAMPPQRNGSTPVLGFTSGDPFSNTSNCPLSILLTEDIFYTEGTYFYGGAGGEGDPLSGLTGTMDGVPLVFYDGLDPATGTLTITPCKFYEYRDASGANPLYDADSGDYIG